MRTKEPRGATRGESSNQHRYQERTGPVSTTSTSQHKPLPPTATLLDAIELERNSGRPLEDIIAESATEHEAGEPTC